MLWKSTDWEAVADRDPDELLSSECLPDVSKITLEDKKVEPPVRRGRGTFSYQKHALYSDQQSGGPIEDNPINQDDSPSPEGHEPTINCKFYITNKVVSLVLRFLLPASSAKWSNTTFIL